MLHKNTRIASLRNRLHRVATPQPLTERLIQLRALLLSLESVEVAVEKSTAPNVQDLLPKLAKLSVEAEKVKMALRLGLDSQDRMLSVVLSGKIDQLIARGA